VPGPEIDRLSAATREANVTLIVSVYAREPDTAGSMYNTTLIFDADGSLVGNRRKPTPTVGERVYLAGGTGRDVRTSDTWSAPSGACCVASTTTRFRCSRHWPAGKNSTPPSDRVSCGATWSGKTAGSASTPSTTRSRETSRRSLRRALCWNDPLLGRRRGTLHGGRPLRETLTGR
jgi:hypothetical protein